jgi:hypothetical protein
LNYTAAQRDAKTAAAHVSDACAARMIIARVLRFSQKLCKSTIPIYEMASGSKKMLPWKKSKIKIAAATDAAAVKFRLAT